MRILILMMLVFASCKKTTTPSVEQNVIVDLCGTEFQEFLQNNLKYVDYPDWAPYVKLIREDQFVETLKTEYISCIKGKTESEIIELFGKPRGSKDEIDPSLTYDCVPAEEDDSGIGEMCLIFKFGEDDLVKYISYYDCWDVID